MCNALTTIITQMPALPLCNPHNCIVDWQLLAGSDVGKGVVLSHVDVPSMNPYSDYQASTSFWRYEVCYSA